ncbi:MAG TPA: BlaI/MecI/CopY family transcriptional regulator [Gemmatimonadaceae bacterium]
MADYHELTNLHLAILGILWQRREATVAEIHEALEPRIRVSRKTVATLLSRLEQRGLVRHRSERNGNVFTTAVRRRTVLVARLAAMLEAVFDSPLRPVAPHTVESREVRPGDVARLRQLLRKAERDLGKRA